MPGPGTEFRPSDLAEGDVLQAARIAMLEKSFGVKLPLELRARCTSPEAAADVIASLVPCADGPGEDLSTRALCVLREAMHEAFRVPRERVEPTTPVAELMPSLRLRAWKRLGKELGCALPGLRLPPAAGVLSAAGCAANVGLIQWSRELDRDAAVPVLFAVCFAGIGLLVVAGNQSTYMGGIGLLIVAGNQSTYMGSTGCVDGLVHFLVATAPAKFRGGAAWARGEIRQATDAVFGLKFLRRGCGTMVASQALIALLHLALVASVIWALVRAVAVTLRA